MKWTSAFRELIRKNRLRTILSFGFKGYLTEIGWFQAYDAQAPVDHWKHPIPWWTYSFIDFLEPRLPSGLRIFEYGSGSSTRYFAAKGADVISVEHDIDWLNKGNIEKPETAKLIYRPLDEDGAYCRAIQEQSESFDMIIVDGRDRVNCCKQAYDRLNEGGVIILDDSERERYNPGRSFLFSKGFRELSFSGISPGLFYKKATSVFYKAGNFLNI